MASIKSIKVGSSEYEIKAIYDGSGNIIDETYAKSDEVPTKLSQLDNDSNYLTEVSLDQYAKVENIPTKMSQLENDSNYLSEATLDNFATKDQVDDIKQEIDSIAAIPLDFIENLE